MPSTNKRIGEVLDPDLHTMTVRGSIVSTFDAGPSDATSMQTLRLVEQSLEFWSCDDEDVYTLDDGAAI